MAWEVWDKPFQDELTKYCPKPSKLREFTPEELQILYNIDIMREVIRGRLQLNINPRDLNYICEEIYRTIIIELYKELEEQVNEYLRNYRTHN